MRHGDDSVMEVSRTWSVAPGAVHRIYLGRTITLFIRMYFVLCTVCSGIHPHLQHAKVYHGKTTQVVLKNWEYDSFIYSRVLNNANGGEYKSCSHHPFIHD